MKFERGHWWAPDLTVDQVREISLACQKEGLPREGLGAEMRPPFSEGLAGRTAALRFGDFRELTYRFTGAESLAWSEDGVNFTPEYCQTLELDAGSGLFFVHHLRSFSFPTEAFTFVIDLENGLVTLVHANVGGFYRPREVDRDFHFGYIVGIADEPPEKLHGFTKEMEGMIIDWHYDKQNLAVGRHIYVNHQYKFDRIIINGETINCAGMISDYVKIRPRIYIMSWVETNTQGVQGTVLMNLTNPSRYHDVGCFFGVNRKGTLDSYTFGAEGIPQEHI
jgi:hypothetical protein